jgi:hypothetical protein
MKESEFIELLNLYLDHEINPEESARLEAEVSQHPDRLELYRQYCRMQKACVVLADQHRENAPAQDAMAAAFAPRSAWSGMTAIWTSGLMAAAAGIAVIALSHRSAVAPSGPSLASAVAAAPTLAAAPVPDQFQPVFVARSLALSPANPKPGLMFTSADQNGQFAWMNRVQIAPIQLTPTGSLFVDPKPQLDLSRPAEDRPQAPDTVEETAFQFHK